MKQLTRIIGPAPSELSNSDLLDKLRSEHHRVSEGLSSWKLLQKPQKQRKKNLSPSLKTIKVIEEELGMTMEELLELAKGN